MVGTRTEQFIDGSFGHTLMELAVCRFLPCSSPLLEHLP